MAGNVKGITIDINADTSGVKRAFRELRKDSKEVEDQLKDVNRALKFDPGNTALLEQKQRLLSQAVASTAKQLQAAEQAQAEFIESGGDVDSAEYTQLVIETEKLRGRLDNLTGQAEDTARALEGTGSAASEAADGADELAESSEEAAESMDKWEVATGALIANGLAKLIGSCRDAVAGTFALADNVNTLANNYSLSTEAAYALYQNQELLDYSVGSVARMMREQTDSLMEGSEAYDALGISVRDANGELLPQQEIFANTLRYLRGIEDPVQRAAEGTELLGTKYYELGGILNASEESFNSFADSLTGTDEDLQADVEGLQAFKDAVDGAKKAATDIAVSLGEFFGWLSDLDGIMPALAVSTAGIAAAWLAFGGAAKVAAAAQAALNVVMNANPIGLIILAVTALIAVFILLWNNSEGFRSFFIGMWDGIKTVVSTAAEAISNKAAEIRQALVEKWQEIKDKFAEAKDAGAQIVNDLLQGIKDKWEGLKAWISGAWDKIKSIFTVSVDMPSGGEGGEVGGYAKGLAYVPYDEFPAYLHQGERVLTREENAALIAGNGIDGNGGGGVTVNQHITMVQSSPIQLAATSRAYFAHVRR